MNSSNYKALFLQETHEHLSGIEKGLLSLEKNPGSKETVDNLFRHYHSIKGMCSSMGYETMQRLAHIQEDLLDGMRKKPGVHPSPEMISTLFECLDRLKDMTQGIEEDRTTDMDKADIEPLIKKIKQSTAVARAESETPSKPIPPELPGVPKLKLSNIMKVEGKVFDDLLNVTGDLLTILSSLRLFAGSSRSIELKEGVHTLGKTIEALHTNILSARMLPFSDLTQNLPRIVRDISKKGAKVVELDIEGGDISLDRSILEKMGDPLIHIIRNAVDHGIEPPVERTNAGKPEKGSISVRAFRRKEMAVIEVADDGRGIDCEKVRHKAVSLGMPEERIRAMPDKEALKIICLPGLSLAHSVTEVSGRGVGMDVVKDTIAGLGGSIEIESSPGRGTKIIMEFPRSASIMKVLLVSVTDELFSLPVSKIEKVIEVKGDEVRRGTIMYHDNEIPVLPLGSALGLKPAASESGTPVVVIVHVPKGQPGEEAGSAPDGLVGLGVDGFVDELDAYIKPLVPPFSKLRGVTGISILGDGRPVFLVDLPQVTEKIKPQPQ
jgi:two-component system chemotaxis sensor kinase CheA